MKKITAIFVTLVLAMAILSGCASSGGGSEPKGSSSSQAKSDFNPTSLADFEKFESKGYVSSKDRYCQIFNDKGTYYRVVIDLTEEQGDALFDVEYDDPDHDKKIKDILNPLPLKSVEVLNDQMLSDKEIAELAGKTGEELLNDGWKANGGCNQGTGEAYMDKGAFRYLITFDGTLTAEDDDALVEEIKPMKVKKAEYLDISPNACDEAVDEAE